MIITKSDVLKSFLWKLLEKCSVQLITFVVTIVLARILTPDEFGLIAIIVVFINLANVIVEGGLTAALVQKKDTDNLDFSTIFFSSIFFAIILYFCIFLLAPYISEFYNNNQLTIIIRILSLILIPCSINSIQKAYVSRFLLFNRMFICAFIAIIISGTIGIVMAYNGFGVWALVYHSIANQVCTTLLMFIFIRWFPMLKFSGRRFLNLFDFGWKIFITNFIIAIYEDVRSLFIGKLYHPSVLAFFDRGKQFPSLIMGNVNTSIQTVLFPTFSAYQDNVPKVKSMMRTATQISCFVVFPLLMLLFISAEPLVKVILTDKWLAATPFIRIFSIAFILMPLQSSNMIAIKSLGYSNIILKLEIVKKFIEAIILVISFQFSIYIVALGVVVYNFLCLFINLYPNKKLLNYSIKEQIWDILPIFIIAIFSTTIASIILFFNLSSIIILILQTITTLASYMFISHLFNINAMTILYKSIRGILE